MSKTIEWSISMEELFRRPPDLTIQCPEWLAEWMEWQDELDASKMLPRIPLDPTGVYLGAKRKDEGRYVADIFRDVVRASGWTMDMAGPALGVSPTVISRLLSAQHLTTIRLYRATAEKLLAASSQLGKLHTEVRRMIDTGAGER